MSVAAGIQGQAPTSEQDPTHVQSPRDWGIEKRIPSGQAAQMTYLGTFSIHTPFLAPAPFSLHTKVLAKIEANDGGQVAPYHPVK